MCKLQRGWCIEYNFLVPICNNIESTTNGRLAAHAAPPCRSKAGRYQQLDCMMHPSHCSTHAALIVDLASNEELSIISCHKRPCAKQKDSQLEEWLSTKVRMFCKSSALMSSGTEAAPRKAERNAISQRSVQAPAHVEVRKAELSACLSHYIVPLGHVVNNTN